MKNWQDLTTTDFVFDEGDDLEGVANMEFNDQELIIQIPNRNFLTLRNLDFIQEALSGWIKNLNQIASWTEGWLQNQLPGRKVKPDELSMWLFCVSEPGGNPKPPAERLGKPSVIEFYYNLLGDYSDPNYELDQFHEDSVIELMFHVKDYKIEWDQPDHDKTNDFA